MPGASAPPQDVFASVISSTSIKVSWSPIEDCSDINGDITGWKIRYYCSITITITVSGSNDANGVVILTGLLFSTEYRIEVAAVNSNDETGVYSTLVFETTLNNGEEEITIALMLMPLHNYTHIFFVLHSSTLCKCSLLQ